VPLAEELADLELFLGIARARFEDRLDVRVTADDEALSAAVPALVLQPLVENALHHGYPGAGDTLVIEVSASVHDGRLVLCVVDNGPGAGMSALTDAGTGIGIANTRRRLQLLHPGQHLFECGDRPAGGFEARIELPATRLAVHA